jgi:DNA-binding NarL/FixJ family response regulator
VTLSSNKQIATCLFLALATVKNHVHHILQKTGLPNRAAIASRFAQAFSDSSSGR